MGEKWRIGDVLVIVILETKIPVFACLLSDEGCDSFPKHLDLTLTPGPFQSCVAAKGKLKVFLQKDLKNQK